MRDKGEAEGDYLGDKVEGEGGKLNKVLAPQVS